MKDRTAEWLRYDEYKHHEMKVRMSLNFRELEELEHRAAAVGMDVGDFVGQIVADVAMMMARDRRLPDSVILDGSIYKRSLLAPHGPEATCLAFAQAKHCKLIVTKTLVQNVRRELREEIVPREQAAQLLRFLKDEVANCPLAKEPDRNAGNYSLTLAIKNRPLRPGGTITLVTRDANCLKCADVRGYYSADFQLRHPGVRVVDPSTFLKERGVERTKSNELVFPATFYQKEVRVLDVGKGAGEVSPLSRPTEQVSDHRRNDLPKKVIFTHDVYSVALREPIGRDAACIASAQAGQAKIVVTERMVEKIRDEFEDVRKNPGLYRDVVALESVHDLVDYLQDEVGVVGEPPEHPNASSDYQEENEVYYSRLAIAEGGDGINLVTNDEFVLRLANPWTSEGEAFIHKHPNIRVITPTEFVNERGMAELESDAPATNPLRGHEHARVLDVARREREESRLGRVMDRVKSAFKEREHER